MKPNDVWLSPEAQRTFKKLSKRLQDQLRRALKSLSEDIAQGGREGKKVRTISGASDSFHRLRTGDYRVMYDVLSANRGILVLGIVNRSDLEKWLRQRR